MQPCRPCTIQIGIKSQQVDDARARIRVDFHLISVPLWPCGSGFMSIAALHAVVERLSWLIGVASTMWYRTIPGAAHKLNKDTTNAHTFRDINLLLWVNVCWGFLYFLFLYCGAREMETLATANNNNRLLLLYDIGEWEFCWELMADAEDSQQSNTFGRRERPQRSSTLRRQRCSIANQHTTQSYICWYWVECERVPTAIWLAHQRKNKWMLSIPLWSTIHGTSKKCSTHTTRPPVAPIRN